MFFGKRAEFFFIRAPLCAGKHKFAAGYARQKWRVL